MDALVWIIVVIALIAIAAIAWAAWRKQRTDALRERFGPEYDRTATETGSRREAESELSSRMKRRDDLDIHALAPAVVVRYAERWREVQEGFVNDPKEAVADSDRLVQEVMRDRGYPVDDFEQRAADLSVDHGDVVDNYRAGHAIALACQMDRASTEDLRQAVVHYRVLFQRLLVTDADRADDAGRTTPTSTTTTDVADGSVPRPDVETTDERASERIRRTG
jgi:hypothetical protein